MGSVIAFHYILYITAGLFACSLLLSYSIKRKELGGIRSSLQIDKTEHQSTDMCRLNITKVENIKKYIKAAGSETIRRPYKVMKIAGTCLLLQNALKWIDCWYSASFIII